ncbi:hypothetical protein NPM_80011 (plasmid) [Nostoc sp. 'Peltigera membranacea cyanobiont' N6]|uniref:CopG-like ribbon-helix-helix domain n=3 Tax=Nostoc TaxID=1177 RepID=A0A2K8TAX4_9NOSO|nr:hypothetical protein COO91_11073 [Nostoc flagelliforme CCNUN1]AVH68584.1 hypothetical protein NPM_80011 [Nostoc sp. 'Peltigera membranacea cyanobiont' N6]
MPSKKPQMTIRIEEDEYKYLQSWANKEFLTVPQLTRVLVKRAIAEQKKLEQNKSA